MAHSIYFQSSVFDAIKKIRCTKCNTVCTASLREGDKQKYFFCKTCSEVTIHKAMEER